MRPREAENISQRIKQWTLTENSSTLWYFIGILSTSPGRVWCEIDSLDSVFRLFACRRGLGNEGVPNIGVIMKLHSPDNALSSDSETHFILGFCIALRSTQSWSLLRITGLDAGKTRLFCNIAFFTFTKKIMPFEAFHKNYMFFIWYLLVRKQFQKVFRGSIEPFRGSNFILDCTDL